MLQKEDDMGQENAISSVLQSQFKNVKLFFFLSFSVVVIVLPLEKQSCSVLSKTEQLCSKENRVALF